MSPADRAQEEKELEAALDEATAKLTYFLEKKPMKLTLDNIAAAGHVSKRTCGNLFKRFLYISPMKYLNEFRLKQSITLLKSTDMTITEIALSCVFSGVSYYAESFRRELGKSPSEYRAYLNEPAKQRAPITL